MQIQLTNNLDQMKNDRNVKLTDKDNTININCQPPLIFSIPSPYEDNNERNAPWFSRLLRLEKKTGQIKETIKAIAKKHAIQYEITRQMIEKTIELNNRFVSRAEKSDHDNN